MSVQKTSDRELGTASRSDAVMDRVQRLRWPISDTLGAGNLTAEVEKMIADGNFEKAGALLEKEVQGKSLQEMRAAITDEGAEPGDLRNKLLAARDYTYQRALLWMLTGDEEYARVAKELLKRFADKVSHWPLYSRQKTVHMQNDAGYLRHPEANGIWGIWHPSDLNGSIPLLRAYDILQSEWASEERRYVEDHLFVFHKELLDKFTGLRPLYHNLSGYHLIPLLRFGQVLQRPAYVHEVVRYWREMLRYSYSPDGFFREVTPDYHRQISYRITDTIPAIVKTYSDPVGYRDPKTGEHFDHYDLVKEQKPAIERIRSALDVLALPDGSLVNLNDSWPKRLRASQGADIHAPGLLGVAGVAKLASGGMTAFLTFGGIRGHDHKDALGLVWYAGKREVFSDTGYREQPDKGIKFDRPWGASTASHLTAAMDEEEHFKTTKDIQIPDPVPWAGFVSYPPETSGKYDLEAALPASARYKNQGRLLTWDARHSEVQAMEAEQENAYPGKASLFRRTLVMVSLGKDTGYLVDIFRMRGGKSHDFFLRGDLGSPYQLRFNQELQPATGTAYTYIHLKESASVRIPLKGTAVYTGNLQVNSLLAGVWGTQPVRLQLMVGEAPAIRRPGNASFSFVRRTGETDEGDLETCWVWVHETSEGEPVIQRVTTDGDFGALRVIVEMEGRRDILFSGLSDAASFNGDSWKFQGRLAWGSEQKGIYKGYVFSGDDLSHGERVAEAISRRSGKILSTTRKDAGDSVDSVLVHPDDASSRTDTSYHVAHIDFGDAIRFSIPIEAVQEEANGLRVILSQSPGFTRSSEGATMTHFPGWYVKGETYIILE